VEALGRRILLDLNRSDLRYLMPGVLARMASLVLDMSNTIKIVIFLLVFVALAADVAFVTWATKLNYWIVVPVALSAAYLTYMAAHLTICRDQKS